jgi:polyisoprenoid-binding protein YceI
MRSSRSSTSRSTALVAVLIATLLAVPAASAASLNIDPDHSTVGFSVRHLFTNVKGQFNTFEGTIEFDQKSLASSKVNAVIQTASIDTNVEARDKDLRSDRFFDAEQFPTLEFTTTSVAAVSETRFKVKGFLTMHGVRKEIVLDAEFLGRGNDPWGNLRYGFHASTVVDRKDFGMQWNEVLETGGVLVGDEVTINLDMEAVPAE